MLKQTELIENTEKDHKMTTKELIDHLQTLNPDAEVKCWLRTGRGTELMLSITQKGSFVSEDKERVYAFYVE